MHENVCTAAAATRTPGTIYCFAVLQQLQCCKLQRVAATLLFDVAVVVAFEVAGLATLRWALEC